MCRHQPARGCPHTPARGSISGPPLGRLLTPASGPDRSIRAVGPQIAIGARARQTVPAWRSGPTVRVRDHPGRPEPVHRSSPPTVLATATHNDALHGGSPGPHRTRNRRSERQLLTATSFPGWDGIGGLSICASLEASNTLWKRGSGEFRDIQGH